MCRYFGDDNQSRTVRHADHNMKIHPPGGAWNVRAPNVERIMSGALIRSAIERGYVENFQLAPLTIARLPVEHGPLGQTD